MLAVAGVGAETGIGWAQEESGVPEARVELEAERRALFLGTAEELEELAGWCQGEKLYAERDRLYGAVLRLQPESRAARRGLKYRRVGRGEWRQSKGYRTPKNRAPESSSHALEELARLEARIVDDYRQALAELDDRHGRSREAFLADLLLVAPDDPEAREARGEVKDPGSGAWLLAESLGTPARRQESARHLESLLQGALSVELELPDPVEAAIPLDWTSFATPRLHVRATFDDETARAYALFAEAAADLYDQALDDPPRLPADTTLYLLERREDRGVFVRNHPELRDVSLGDDASFWIPRSSKFAVETSSHDARVDHIVRNTVQRMILENFGPELSLGWLGEGMAVYLTSALTGRSSILIRPLDPEAVFRGTARELREAAFAELAKRELDLERRCALRLAEMDRSDYLLAYAFATYLIEARRPADVVDLLGQLGWPVPADEALESALEMTADELDERVARWAEETAAGAAREE